jgi:serine/threonine protein kinase
MSVTLTGYKGGASAPGASQVGIAGLRDAIKNDQTKVKANEILASLRNDLRTKTGVLRLLHTSDADKAMKFQNSGGFKQIFLSGAKLQRSGEVVSDLLKAAGLSDEKAKEFDQYVTERGHSGVKAQKVLEFIDSIKVQTSDTEENAVKNMGVTVQSAESLGQGGNGVVKPATYKGNDYVYKQPIKHDSNLGLLFLANEQGETIYPQSSVPLAPEMGPSAVADKQKTIDQNFHPTVPQKEVTNEKRQSTEGNYFIAQKYEQRSSSSSESDYANVDDLMIYIFKNAAPLDHKFKESDRADHNVTAHSKHPILSDLIGENDDQVVPNDGLKSGVKFKIKEEAVSSQKSNNLSELELQIDQPLKQEAADSPSKPQLARKGIANAARVKNLPQVITPTVYVLRETPKQGPAQYHAIEGSVALKAWASKQSLESTFEVTGLLMPKATGRQPLEYSKSAAVNSINVQTDDLKPMAQSGLNLLKGLAAHGFIHGDIKPENLMWDSHTKNLQLIDNDSLKKISKTSKESGINDAYTQIYLNPVAWKHKPPGNEAKLGIGRDLFALGMVILETSLYAKGQGDKANQLMEKLTFGNERPGRAKYLMSQDKYQNGIQELQDENFDANSIEAFARSCIIESIQLEERRLAGNITAFERYDETQPDAQHLLAKLEGDLAQIK